MIKIPLFHCNYEMVRGEIKSLTSKRYLERQARWFGTDNQWYIEAKRRSDALKWIYQNCRRKYRIYTECHILIGEMGDIRHSTVSSVCVCEFEREQDAVQFKLIFSDLLDMDLL